MMIYILQNYNGHIVQVTSDYDSVRNTMSEFVASYVNADYDVTVGKDAFVAKIGGVAVSRYDIKRFEV